MFADGGKKSTVYMKKTLRKKSSASIRPAKRAAAKVACAFGAVALACALGFAVANKVRKENGIGGLETAGLPHFNERSLVEAEQGALPLESENAETAAYYGTDEGALDAALALLEETGAAAKELSYFTYRVKAGDMIGYIADEYGITQDTIISVNGIRQSRLLQVGQYLKIPSMPGILYTVREDGESPETIAQKFDVSAEKCARVNSLGQTAALNAGVTLFVPDAELDSVTLAEINGDLFRTPLRARYTLSSYYGWRRSPFTGARSFHSGIDMAAPQGTSIYAALAGRVTTVGYNATYGNYVIVTHHSGYRTLYAHMSAVLVVNGQNVDTDTRLGRVGSTGLSTGPHLHFSVFKWNNTVNPLELLR